MTQKQLADAIGVNAHAHISRIEKGEVNVSLDTANSLAKAVGRTAIDLLTPHGERAHTEANAQTSGTAPVRKGDLALEFPQAQAFDLAVTAAAKFGRPVRLVDPATREVVAVVPHRKTQTDDV